MSRTEQISEGNGGTVPFLEAWRARLGVPMSLVLKVFNVFLQVGPSRLSLAIWEESSNKVGEWIGAGASWRSTSCLL